MDCPRPFSFYQWFCKLLVVLCPPASSHRFLPGRCRTLLVCHGNGISGPKMAECCRDIYLVCFHTGVVCDSCSSYAHSQMEDLRDCVIHSLHLLGGILFVSYSNFLLDFSLANSKFNRAEWLRHLAPVTLAKDNLLASTRHYNDVAWTLKRRQKS